MQALDELVARWRKNPDTEATVALCAHLGTSKKSDLMREVGNTAEAWHKGNHEVMLSVGRMYLDAGLLAEAQASFLQAGKAAPADPEAYRFLGEVLLRRGDAVRSERALAKAIKLGDDAGSTRLWHERAVVYAALQKRRGSRAVADEVARTAPHQPSIPSPALPPESTPAKTGRTQRRSRPPGAHRPTGPRRSSPPGALRRRPAEAAPAHAPKTAPHGTLMMGDSARAPAPTAGSEPSRFEPPPAPFFPTSSQPPSHAGPVTTPPGGEPVEPFFPVEGPSGADVRPRPSGDPFADAAATREEPPDPQRRIGTIPDLAGELQRTASAGAPSLRVGPRGEIDVPPESFPMSPDREPAHTLVDADPAHVEDVEASYDELNPSPEAVLLTLSRVGLFESEGSITPAWETPRKPVPRRLWGMAGAVALSCGLAVAGYRHAISVQAERAAQAQAIAMRVADQLDRGSPAQLKASESDFQTLFDLDSRSPEAARLWLKNRSLHVLATPDPTSGIEAALQRARSVGADEAGLAFGRIASALAADDLPGAARVISEWDERAASDPYFQLFAGAVFERAGDPGALERFQKAIALQTDLAVAHAMAARLAILQKPTAESKAVLEPAAGHLGQGPESQVLRALHWATAPADDAPAPPMPDPAALDALPFGLQQAARGALGVAAHRQGRPEEARGHFEAALTPQTAPALAAWIGYQALEVGAVDVARRAALRAMKISARHSRSRALAARIALAEGRLPEAQKATAGLPQSSRDAVIIEAVTAYENLRGDAIEKLLGDLTKADDGASLSTLARGAGVIDGLERASGDELEKLSGSQLVWGEVIATDLALDSGDLERARALVAGWDPTRPAHALRLSRLHRYAGNAEGSLQAAQTLLESDVANPRSLAEAVLALVDAGRVTAAAGAVEAAAGGDLEPFLAGLVEAARGRQRAAQKGLRAAALPPRSAPLVVQVTALRALARARDRRANSYLAQLARRFPKHPDVALAGQDLGR